MWHRFFKLIYIILFLGIIIYVPIYFIFDSTDRSYNLVNYKVKCKENGKYIVLQGSKLDEHLTVTKNYLDSDLLEDKRKVNNFYCKYYSEIQNHLSNYFETDYYTQANIDFQNFKNNKLRYVNTYPELYVLEIQYDHYFWEYAILYPIIDSLTYGMLLFIVLQILKISYTYVKFGEFTPHPFRSKKKTFINRQYK